MIALRKILLEFSNRSFYHNHIFDAISFYNFLYLSEIPKKSIFMYLTFWQKTPYSILSLNRKPKTRSTIFHPFNYYEHVVKPNIKILIKKYVNLIFGVLKIDTFVVISQLMRCSNIFMTTNWHVEKIRILLNI